MITCDDLCCSFATASRPIDPRVRHLLTAGCTWLRAEWLPGYAPELDPVESIWNQSKYGDLANWIPSDIVELHETLDQLLCEYRQDPDRLHSFFAAAQLSI